MSQPVASIVPVVWPMAAVVRIPRLVSTGVQTRVAALTPRATIANAEAERRSSTLIVLRVLSLNNSIYTSIRPSGKGFTKKESL